MSSRDTNKMAKTPVESGVSRRTGGRTARVVASVHAATLMLLEEKGYDRTEIPEIAERAQVYKTSIYRRWPTKMELILDVALTHLSTAVPVLDTGSLEGDLTALLSRITEILSTPFAKGLLRALLVANELDENFQKARSTFWNARFGGASTIIERAIKRGELAVETNPKHFVELAAAPLFYRTLITGEEVNDDDIQRLVHQTCRAFI